MLSRALQCLLHHAVVLENDDLVDITVDPMMLTLLTEKRLTQLGHHFKVPVRVNGVRVWSGGKRTENKLVIAVAVEKFLEMDFNE